MADTKPLKIDAGRTQQFATGDTVPITNGGTGATTEAGARTNLAVAGTGVSNTFTQPQTIQATSDAATLGSELVTNGTFTGNADGWTLGTNWAYGSNNVIVTLDGATEGTLTQNISVTNGTAYLIEWSQTNSVANNGTIRPSIGAANGLYVSPTSTTVATMSQVLTAIEDGSVALTFDVTDSTSTGTITIDSVTVKAITPIDAALILKDTESTTQVEMRVANSASDGNTAVGLNALRSNTTGYNNSAHGINALFSNTTGYSNSAYGANALISNTTGHNNSALGVGTLRRNSAGAYNTAQGVTAMYPNTTGSGNSAHGYRALYANTTGNFNSALGRYALGSNITGSSNVAIGSSAGFGITTGSYNTILGADVSGLAAGLTGNIILAANGIKAQFDGTNWTFQGAVLFQDGTAAAPSIADSTHTGTGVYFPAANELGISTGGAERVRVGSTGKVGIGILPGVTNARLIMAAPDSDAQTFFLRYSNDNIGPQVRVAKTRSTNPYVRSAVSTNDTLGSFLFQLDTGSGYANAAAISAVASGTISPTSSPSMLQFSTTPDGSTALAERVRITNAGNVGVANTAPAEKLDVTGNIKASGVFLAPDGTAAAPSIANSDHTGTGISFGTNTLSVSTAGVSRVTFNADGSLTNQAGASGTIAVLGDDPSASPTYAELGSAAYASLEQAQDQTSIGWKDMLAPLVGSGMPPSAAPSMTDFEPGGWTQRRELAFAINDYCYVQPFHVNHDVKPGGKAYIHVHWTTNNTSTNSVRWAAEISRAKGHNQAAFGAPVTVYLEQQASGTAYQHMVTECADADALTLTEPDELILVTIKRIDSVLTANNTDTVFGLMVDLHYEAAMHHTPNKAPNFYGET